MDSNGVHRATGWRTLCPYQRAKPNRTRFELTTQKLSIFLFFHFKKFIFVLDPYRSFLDMAKAKSKKNSSGGATEQAIGSNVPSMSVCDWLNIIWNVIGVIAALGLAYHHMWYCYIQHENEMWFTNIKEVERERRRHMNIIQPCKM